MPLQGISPVKITRPTVPETVPRKRLHRLLDRGRSFPITWIWGPPGSGKTTLAAGYLHARKQPCLWYQVDEGDGDLATFFLYVNSALQKALRTKRKPLPFFTDEYSQGFPVFTHRYFEALFSRLRPPFFLVLDNFQEAPVQSGFPDMIVNGLETIPAGIRVFILSRNEPPAPFARLHAENRIQFIGWNDLRFTAGESRTLILRRSKRRVPEEACRNLGNLTEGWVAGLILLVYGSGEGTPVPLSSGNRSFGEIFDYFGREFFDKKEPDTRDLLLKTSFTPEITAQVAEGLTENSLAGKILADLSRNSHFTTTHAVAGIPVYQYHPLFREFLSARAQDILSPEERMRLRRKAAFLLEESGQEESAIKLFAEAEDWDNLVRLIRKRANFMINHGRGKTLREWIGLIPRARVAKEPWLLYWSGVSNLLFNPQGNIDLFERALDLFLRQKDSLGIFMTWDSIMTHCTWRGYKQLDRWIDWFYKNIPADSVYPSLEIEATIVSKMANSLSYRRPAHPDLPRWMERAHSLAERINDDELRKLIWLHANSIYSRAGDLGKMKFVFEKALRIPDSSKFSPSKLILFKAAEAGTYYLLGDLKAATAAVERGLEIAQASGVYIWNSILFTHGILSRLAKGDLTTAAQFLQIFKPETCEVSRSTFLYHLVSALYFFRCGELAHALEHAETALRISREMGYPQNEVAARHLLAQVLQAKGEMKKASSQIHLAAELIPQTGSTSLKYSNLMSKAHFALDGGMDSSGLRFLKEGLQLGREQGYLGFVDRFIQPSVMARLCARALAAGIEVDHVENLIRKQNLVPPLCPSGLENWPWPIKIYTLGRFEILKDGEPLRFSRKVQKRPLEMLKILTGHGGREVPEEHVADNLWPEGEGDAAHHSFTTNLYRLRELLGSEGSIRLQEGKLNLDPQYCWTDAWAFDRLCEETRALWEKGARSKDPLMAAESALSLYRGHFLPADEGASWSLSSRERLRNRFVRLVLGLGESFEGQKKWKEAAQYYERGLEVDDLIEEFYQHLIICFQHLEQFARAVETYRLCQKTLQSVFGVDPSPKTQVIYKTLLEKAKSKF